MNYFYFSFIFYLFALYMSKINYNRNIHIRTNIFQLFIKKSNNHNSSERNLIVYSNFTYVIYNHKFT